MTRKRTPPEPTNCEHCGKIFQPCRKGNICCSKQCSYDYWYARNKESEKTRSYEDFLSRRAPATRLNCANCSKEFETHYAWKRTCSKECKQKLAYAENSELRKASSIAVRRRHAEAYRARDRATWAEMHKTRGSKKAIYAKSKSPWLPLLTGARHRCIKKQLPFNLDEAWCIANWDGKCKLTGIEFDLISPGRSVFSPSIDRIEPAKGYVRNNCRFILFGVNLFKFTSTDEEMLRIAEALIATAIKSPHPRDRTD